MRIVIISTFSYGWWGYRSGLVVCRRWAMVLSCALRESRAEATPQQLMITKIVVTILVIVGALIFVQRRQPRPVPRAQSAAAETFNRRTLYLALSFAALTAAASGLMYYWHWQEAHEVFIVKVVNTQSNSEQLFQVYRDGVKGRSFQTTDGRMITLSANERMEVEKAE